MQPYLSSKIVQPYSEIWATINAAVPRFLCCNKCSRTPWPYLEIRALTAPRNLCTNFPEIVPSFSNSTSACSALSSALLFSWKWKVKSLCLPQPFLFALSEFLNPTVEKESNQWPRWNESENHFYLFLINKITHPLKFIKKWLYGYKVSLSDF